MRKSEGFAAVLVMFGIVLVVAAFVVGGIFFSNKDKEETHSLGQPLTSIGDFQDKEHGSQGGKSAVFSDAGANDGVFYNENGIVIEHNFPGENNLSSEESEMYVYNETDSEITFTKTSMDYLINGVAQGGKSDTWELFPDARSWDKIQYTNIGEGYGDGTPLVVSPGQKAKIHYHYDTVGGSAQSESVQINLAFTQDGTTQAINKTLERK